jgi:4-amino-4-deoxy-L-arabinose transferase-like glycosyltransferase
LNARIHFTLRIMRSEKKIGMALSRQIGDLGPTTKWFRRSVGSTLLCLTVFLYAMAFQGSRGLWERDEGRYTNIAVQMLRSGDFLQPGLNDDVHHFTKPPLTYWAIAAGVSLLGRNEWGARLPNAVAFTGTILVLLAFGKMITPKRPWLPPLVYGSSLLPFGAANFVTTDTLLTFWETLGVLGFVHWRSHPAKNHSSLLLMWTGFALAFLTKGPPGLLPALVIVLFLMLQDGWRGLFRPVTGGGLVIFVVLGLGWYLLVGYINSGLAGYFLREEVIHRVASGASFNRNSSWYGAFVVYVPTLICGSLPWTFLLLRSGRFLPRTLLSRSWWKEKRAKDPWLFFLLLWVLVPLVIFWISRSRLPLYILPLFVPLSLITSRLIIWSPLRRSGACLLVVWLLALVACKWGASKYPYPDDSRRIAREIAETVSPRPSELVFVDTRPFFGLGFYLDCEVEHVHSRAEPHPVQYGEEILEVELARREPGTLLVVPRKQKADLMALLAGLGYAARNIAEIHTWSLITPTAEFEGNRKIPRTDSGDPAQSS